MQQVIEITAPFFALIFLGTILKSIKFLDEQKTIFLSRFAFYILMPTMLFFNISKTYSTDSFDFEFLFCYETATIMLILITVLSGKIFNKNLSKSTIMGLNISYPNYGYIGIPMSLVAFGKEAALPLAFILLVDTIVLLTCSSFFIAISEKKSSFIDLIYKLVRRIISQPLLVAVCFGMCFSQLKINIASPVEVFIETVAGAAAPVALIALGASITLRFPAHQKIDLVIISVGKLILHPCLIVLIFFLWPTEKTVWLQTAILCASLPVAANVFVLAEYYGVFKRESANSIVITTILSTFTLPIALYFVLNIT